MSAFGPRGRALTAKLGAGWMCGGNRRGAKRTSVLTGGLNDKPEIRNRKFWAVQSDISDLKFLGPRSQAFRDLDLRAPGIGDVYDP